jgi:NADH-quinone oxidoreductase subunit B
MAANYDGFLTTTFDNVVNWSRKFSLFQYPFVTACCGMEYMAAACSHYDISRFGAEIPRFSPRQSDVLWVVGTITHKMTPVLKTVYEQMAEPKWVIAFGACASSGGFYQNYSVLQGIDRLIPVDIYIAGCPPRPEAVLDGLMELQDRIQNDGPTVKSKMINPQAIRHKEAKIEQLDHYFRIPKKEVFENVQNPKSNRSIKPGFTYNQNQANVSPNMGYDTPKGFQQKEALREE